MAPRDESPLPVLNPPRGCGAISQRPSLLRNLGKSAALPAASIGSALLLGGIIVALLGISPFVAYYYMLVGAFGGLPAIGETLVKATPLILTGLSFALAFRCGLVNIGAEGQLFMGGFGAAVAGIYLKGLPAYLHLPLALAAGLVAGGLWGALCGYLKTRFGASEIITTVMMNYVAIYWVSYVVAYPMIDPVSHMPQTAQVQVTAQLPRILLGTRVHLGLGVALLAVVFFAFYLWRTTRGFETRVVGQNPHAAAYAGMNAKANVLLAMFLAGGMAGLAGACEILGVQLRLYQGFSPGYGFDGIAVALLGRNTPVGIVLAALLFGALQAGGNVMQMLSQVPAAVTGIIQALVIVFVAAEGIWHFRRRLWPTPVRPGGEDLGA